MPYYLDLSAISLDVFRQKLLTEYLIPSQRILLNDLKERLDKLKTLGYENLEELKQAMKKKEKLRDLADASGVPLDYLTVLRRTVNGYHPQPRKIKDFPTVRDCVKQQLHAMGIKTTVDLYDHVLKKDQRSKLKNALDISDGELLQLTHLSDVCRLRYVNETFATLLVISPYHTVHRIRQANAQKMYNAIIAINEDTSLYRARIRLEDMQFLIEDAYNLTLDIEY